MLQEDDVDFSAFVNAVEATERKEAQTNSNQKGFEFPECVGVGNKAIVRFVNGIAETALDKGKPGSGRAKLFNIGWIRDDNNKPFLLTLPAIINNKPMYNSTMIDFIDKVLSRTYITAKDPTTGEDKSGWKYFYEERDDYGQQTSGEMTLKQIFWNVFKSGAQPSNQYYKSQKSWRGQTVYIANVIDRLDYKWHQENKKTKLLMRNVTVRDNTIRHKEISNYAIGTPLKELAENHGTKLDYDVLIVPGAQPMDKFTLKNISKLKEVNYWDDVKGIITEEDKAKVSTVKGFTDEEKAWEPIDIDKYYRFTSATTILRHFGKTIKNFDMMVGTNFYDKFKEEADAEAKVKNTVNQVVVDTIKEMGPAVTVQKVADVPSFEDMKTVTSTSNVVDTAAPEPLTASPEAQNDIDTFYSSL